MEKSKRAIKYLLFAVLIAIITLVGFVRLALPMAGKAEVIKIDITKQRIERGKYLANHVCLCMDCHSKRDWTKFSGPLIPGTLGMGGEEFNQQMGFPGKFYSKNITPAALKNWSDGEILRAFTCGVNRDNKALFPLMPYLNFGQLDKEDLYSIVAYIRTLTPIENHVPDSEPDFPMNFIINTIPQKAVYSSIPHKSNKVDYGKYIFTAASCADCHTPTEKGKPIPGKDLAGGFKVPMPTGGFVNSANITPDIETGIGSWTEEKFVSTFKKYTDSNYKPQTVHKGEFNTFMPWMMYSGMETEDLKALYAYLRTIKPVRNEVIKFTAE